MSDDTPALLLGFERAPRMCDVCMNAALERGAIADQFRGSPQPIPIRAGSDS
jgi:hypothetical protein